MTEAAWSTEIKSQGKKRTYCKSEKADKAHCLFDLKTDSQSNTHTVT